jgi:hypothetical protein
MDPLTIKVTSVSVGRTINTGNYNSERIDFTADVREGEDARTVANELVMACDKYEVWIKARKH